LTPPIRALLSDMPTETPEHVVALVTAPPDRAAELARRLVEEKLAACVNVVPAIRSIYRWKGELCDDGEALLVIKTRAALFGALRARVVELHPYEVPEVIELPILAGHAPYLSWIDESTR
jgi:periplasmic divalent cation tolerance protein